MDLFNETEHPAEIFYTVAGEDRLLASIVLRATFGIDGDALVRIDEAAWPLDGQAFETEFGAFDPDTPFAREGVDLFVLGRAYPAKAPGRTAEVEVRVGSTLSYRIRVVGDRRWVRAGPDLVPSEPEPFESIPLTWERAYGGTCPALVGQMPFHANPRGRGFYVDAESAEGGPLPNLEDPDAPVRKWDDQPEPRSTAPCPQEFSLRALNSAEFDTSVQPPRLERIKPSYFNNANPRLILRDAPPPGSEVAVSGVRPGGGGLRFQLPELAFHAYVQLADRRYVFPSTLDAIAVFAEAEHVVLGYRCCFRYRMVPLERRAAVLKEGPAPPALPDAYTIDWDRLDAQEAGRV